jgi:hypothetical protein
LKQYVTQAYIRRNTSSIQVHTGYMVIRAPFGLLPSTGPRHVLYKGTNESQKLRGQIITKQGIYVSRNTEALSRIVVAVEKQ